MGFHPHPNLPPSRGKGLDSRARVEGRTFDFTFALPWPHGTRGGPKTKKKPARTRPQKSTKVKTTQKATPKVKKPKRSTEPNPSQAETKRRERNEYDRTRNQTTERKERARLVAQERRRKAKDLGLCRDCPSPAIPSQTRCELCAEEHRVSRRKNNAKRRAKPVVPGQQIMPVQSRPVSTATTLQAGV